MSFNFFQDMMASHLNNLRIIPHNWCPQRFHCISFHGWTFSLDVNDRQFDEVLKLAVGATTNFLDTYKNTHAFTDPQLVIKDDATVTVRIGLMENERYENLRNEK